MASESIRLVRRYCLTQRLVHWLGVLTFLTLLLSGIILVVSPLASLAAGGTTRLIHRIAVVPFMLLPILYLTCNPKQAKELVKESFTFTRADIEWFKHMPAYFLGRTKGLPPQGRINAGQKIHHAATFIMFITIALSGFVLWFGKGQLGTNALALTAMVHDLSMLGLSVLMIGHLYFTFVYDAISGMVRGYVTEEYAKMEHPKWLEELPENQFIVKKKNQS
ncbi:MAG: cytochrome b/b6 domain-containing protein [Chloroflexi bacterium]|nr:cytochrome b/b6 domain-containing protein [Chloroflexota bacterium]